MLSGLPPTKLCDECMLLLFWFALNWIKFNYKKLFWVVTNKTIQPLVEAYIFISTNGFKIMFKTVTNFSIGSVWYTFNALPSNHTISWSKPVHIHVPYYCFNQICTIFKTLFFNVVKITQIQYVCLVLNRGCLFINLFFESDKF